MCDGNGVPARNFQRNGFFMAIFFDDDCFVLNIKFNHRKTSIGFVVQLHPTALTTAFVKDTETPDVSKPHTTFEFQIFLNQRWGFGRRGRRLLFLFQLLLELGFEIWREEG